MEKIIAHSKPHVSEQDVFFVSDQIRSGMHATGSKTREFEEKIAELIGKKYDKATTSGTTSLHLSLMALDIKKGDEVIIPSFVCQSLLNAVNYTNATPILADIEENYLEKGYNISADSIENLLSKNTKAIIVPHMFGVPADLESISSVSSGVPIIEDCAQSLGAKYNGKMVGSFGDISSFSFYATKVISTGQGGMVLTDSEKIKKNLDNLLKYDRRENYELAFNFGMTDIQASLGLSQLDKLPFLMTRRNKIREMYDSAFKNLKISKNTPGSFSFRYILSLKDADQRDSLQTYLNDKGIMTDKPIFNPLHNYLHYDGKKFKNSEKAQNSALSIPIYPALKDEEVDYVIKNILDFFKKD